MDKIKETIEDLDMKTFLFIASSTVATSLFAKYLKTLISN